MYMFHVLTTVNLLPTPVYFSAFVLAVYSLRHCLLFWYRGRFRAFSSFLFPSTFPNSVSFTFDFNIWSGGEICGFLYCLSGWFYMWHKAVNTETYLPLPPLIIFSYLPATLRPGPRSCIKELVPLPLAFHRLYIHYQAVSFGPPADWLKARKVETRLF